MSHSYSGVYFCFLLFFALLVYFARFRFTISVCNSQWYFKCAIIFIHTNIRYYFLRSFFGWLSSKWAVIPSFSFQLCYNIYCIYCYASHSFSFFVHIHNVRTHARISHFCCWIFDNFLLFQFWYPFYLYCVFVLWIVRTSSKLIHILYFHPRAHYHFGINCVCISFIWKLWVPHLMHNNIDIFCIKHSIFRHNNGNNGLKVVCIVLRY